MPDLTTAAGVIVALATVVGVLWRDHVRADAEDRRQRDVAMDGWKAQTAATNLVADEITELRRDVKALRELVATLRRQGGRP